METSVLNKSIKRINEYYVLQQNSNMDEGNAIAREDSTIARTALASFKTYDESSCCASYFLRTVVLAKPNQLCQ